jgi:uncharacterized RmlC-like cupin family protein
MSATNTMKTRSIAGRRGLVVKAGAEHRVKQGADYQPGVSAETVGSQVIWLGLMTAAARRADQSPCPRIP